MFEPGMRVRVRRGVDFPLRWYRLDGTQSGSGLIKTVRELVVVDVRLSRASLAPTLVMLNEGCGFYNAACFEEVPQESLPPP